MCVSAGHFSALLPDAAVVTTIADVDDRPLRQLEATLVRDAGERRRSEFARGRRCGHDALLRLGRGADAIGVGPRGEPLWPPGVLGSITHTDTFAASAVALRRDVTLLGIDAEPNLPIRPRVYELITQAVEREQIGEMETTWRSLALGRLLFSAKEAAFKALSRRFAGISFTDVTIALGARTFDATWPGGPTAQTRLEGRWCAIGGLLLTAAWRTAPGRPVTAGASHGR